MAWKLDDAKLIILYHALGANLSQGLIQFEVAFQKAATAYRLDDIDALLDLLADPTLQDGRRLVWHHYYRARKALLQWQPQQIDRILDQVELQQADAPLLEPRLILLRGQARVMCGDWVDGLVALKRATGLLQAIGASSLVAEAEEWTARSFQGRAQSSGSWATFGKHKLSLFFRYGLGFILLPFYLPVLLYLKMTGAGYFWQATFRYGADYSNWPIFVYYLRAFRAINRAVQLASSIDSDRSLRLEIMRADLLRQIMAFEAAAATYQELLDNLPEKGGHYQTALLKQGLAQVRLDLDKVTEADVLLQAVYTSYKTLNHQRGIAQVDLLRGDIAFQTQSIDTALSLWRRSLDFFEARQDASGMAAGLRRCYTVLDGTDSPVVKEQVSTLLHTIKRQVFPIRLSNRLFNLLQLLGWATPILVMLGIIANSANFVTQASRTEMRQAAWDILSWKSLMVVGAILLIVAMINILLGLFGLISTLFTESTRLDFITIDQMGVRRYNYAGREQVCLPWSDITTYLIVERALWHTPTDTLSFDYLRKSSGKPLRLPGTITWFKYLQQEVGRHIQHPPRRYRLRWFGGVLLVLMAVISALSFMLTDAIIPGVSVTGHAWLASLISAGAFVGICLVTASWISHYIKVGYCVTPSRQFVPGISLLGMFLVVLGIAGKRLLFPSSSLVIFWGVALLFALVQVVHHSTDGPTWRRPLATAAGGVIAVVGGWFVLRALLPILLLLQAFTYAGAVHKLYPEQAVNDPGRAIYFAGMGQTGKWMVAIDPNLYQGYGYMGYAYYFQGDYQASVDAYSNAIRISGSHLNYGFFYCRALAYHALGENIRATQDLKRYETQHTPGDIPGCQSFFPEAIGIFEIK